jgi:anthranilate phosphoribosyltransferase
MSLVPFLHRVADRESLSADQAKEAMDVILSGQSSTSQIAAFLVALRMKGEAPDELLGFARAMREHAVPVRVEQNGHPLVDTCGTGGAAKTFNISTITAFVVAGAGVRVAKHGNRSLATLCGSADILEGLGVDIVIPPDRIAACIREVGIGFMFAPAIHPAMKHAQPARAELKMRTAFNLLGPLTNPARANVQLVGAPSVRAAELMAQALGSLGVLRAFVVHGVDGGLDEITTTGETLALEIRSGVIADHTLVPEDFGVPRARIEDLKGGDCLANCEIARRVLSGEKGPRRDVVLVNSSAALVAAGRASDFREGVRVAAESLDSGAAMSKLTRLIAFTREQPATA